MNKNKIYAIFDLLLLKIKKTAYIYFLTIIYIMIRVMLLNKPILFNKKIIHKSNQDNVIIGGKIQQVKPNKKLPIKFSF